MKTKTAKNTNANANGTLSAVSRAASTSFPHSNLRGRRSKLYPNVCLERLAKSVNLSSGYISRVMRGLNKPSLDVAQRIARELNVSLDQLTEAIYLRPKPESKRRTAR